MPYPDSDSELSELSSSLFTSLDAFVSDRSSSSSSTPSQLARPNLVAIPPPSNRDALHQIEALFESIVDAVSNDEILEIPLQTSRSRASETRHDVQTVVRFPGRNAQEAARFGAPPSLSILLVLTRPEEGLFRVLEVSHEALLSGNVITKRLDTPLNTSFPSRG